MDTRRNTRQFTLAATLAIALVATMSVLTAGTATASTPEDLRAKEKHCLSQVTDSGTFSEPACYDSFRSLVRDLTGRTPRVDLTAANATDRDLNPHLYASAADSRSETTDVGVSAATVIGISYLGSNFTGSSWVHSTSGGCTSSQGWSISSLSGTAWDNAISSARTYANCVGEYWEYTNFGGALKLCGCSSMQAMDNKASSIRWRLG